MPTVLRTWATAFVGLLLLQAVWLLVVPPFQGADEHDHVFKAAAVARGDWSGTHPKVDVGRGELLDVPKDIVNAAMQACEALDYTLRDDCNPSGDLADGRVLVGSSAARYNPAFYAVVGTAALPFDGIAAGYAMRVATAVWCAALMALAIAVLRRTARTRWPAVAMLTAFTPTMVYSTSIVAPNGPEMAAGLLLWSTLLFGAVGNSPAPRWVVGAGTFAAVNLAVLRSLGPLWLAAILGTAALAIGVPAFLRAARDPRFRLPGLVTTVALATGVAWTLTSGTNSPTVEETALFSGSPWPNMLTTWLAWIFQQVGAVPSRGNMSPVYVYAVILAAWAILLALALRVGRPRTRLAILAVFAVASTISITLTVLTYSSVGYAWQGRYAWPYVVGWLMLAGWVVDRSPRETRGPRWITLVVGAATAGCVTAVAFQALGIYSDSPYIGAGWSAPHPVLVCGLVAAGTALLLLALRRQSIDHIDGDSQFSCGRPRVHPDPSGNADEDRIHVQAREAGRQALIR